MKYSRMQRGKKWSVTSLGDESCSRCGVCLTKMLLVLLSVLLCSSLTGARLQIQKLDVPSIVDPRWESVSLRCEYDLGGKDLYSVTWYKDDQEFFNYKPSEPKRDRGIDGVYVDLNLSNSKQVTLLGPNYHRGKTDLAGSYGCEVSSEGPSFETDYKQANMSVAVLPEHQPVLNGMRPSYEVGEILEAECTSALSYPPAVLTFILNSKENSVSNWLLIGEQRRNQNLAKWLHRRKRDFFDAAGPDDTSRTTPFPGRHPDFDVPSHVTGNHRLQATQHHRERHSCCQQPTSR
ncbi:uncharacterized protein LOC109859922 isoform X2 [Pseudomyrmex gracilis]|uniref:uncharacterized protein LOC109859922 isoform X2 n=1 Tax=Pseudomyrmex gracilis TaxID=219809 RepID=UPI000995AE5B|nr:uncharacterized protein LOC109859922 isoform X2 [Pseudomyrmex gracilis]